MNSKAAKLLRKYVNKFGISQSQYKRMKRAYTAMTKDERTEIKVEMAEAINNAPNNSNPNTSVTTSSDDSSKLSES